MQALITPVVYGLVAMFKNTIPEKQHKYIPYVAFLIGGVLAGIWGVLNGQTPTEIFETVLTGLGLGFGATGLENAVQATKGE